MENIIIAEIENERGCLRMSLPVDGDGIVAHLGSIGIRTPADELPLSGKDGVTIHLTSQDELGEQILAHIAETDSLWALHQACRVISQLCPFGCGRLPQHLQNSSAQSVQALFKDILQFGGENTPWIFHLKLRSPEGPDNSVVNLYLPTAKELLTAISREVLHGAPLEHCEVIGHACQWADEFPGWPLERPEIDSLNTLAGEISKQYRNERPANVLLAAIEAEKPVTVSELLEIAQHPERYQLLPQSTDTAEDYYEYSRNVSRVSRAIQTGDSSVHQTSFGYLTIEPHEPEYGQTFGGIS